jgi:hypothetical protein
VESLPDDAAFDAGKFDPHEGAIWMAARGRGAWRGSTEGDFTPVPLGFGPAPAIRSFGFEADGSVLVATTSGLYRWRDGEGATPVGGDLTSGGVTDLLVHPDGDLYLALPASGVHRSADGGDTWEDLSAGMVPPRPTCLALRATGGETLLAGTFAKGVFLRSLAEDLPATGTPPERRALTLECAPNPFNPRTELRLTLAAEARVLSAIHDRRGRRVALLHDGPLPAGTTRWVFEGRDDRGRPLASGVYLWRVDTRGTRASRSLTLVR